MNLGRLEDLLINPDQLGGLLFSAVVIFFFIYSVILSLLQVRQINILQRKVNTPFDNGIKILTYIYLFVQILLFVIVLVLL
ncbi:MAG: hypothetical protein KatS3mg084_0582 [Candidatus Dojkabacteria bacterium]|nr:MAG: hypothetical protein KatS3mg084_0582 [Candidatus Dojkabacteria bacterium]